MVDELVSVPERGDFIWADLDTADRQGHEQKGIRPALIVSGRDFNRILGLAIVCPVTTEGKGYPFEVDIPSGLNVEGFILTDQIRAIDWRTRRVQVVAHAPDELLKRVLVVVRSFFA